MQKVLEVLGSGCLYNQIEFIDYYRKKLSESSLNGALDSEASGFKDLEATDGNQVCKLFRDLDF